MSLPYSSVATIKDIEFVNLEPTDISPLISKCEIKVMYVGQNRNRSFITKEVAAEMSKTLRGNPIVGVYKEDKQDFSDHGDQMIIDGEGIKFNCLTKPYGFVAPDAKVWFKEFEDTDNFGNKIIREYLMTTGYLWTGQYEEAKSVIKHGKPHSMELDDDTLDGKWSTDLKSGMEFFIINDAIFSKLCILGDDVEPCFEGSSITAPGISKSFALDNDFKQSLYTMMQQLKFALEGGQHLMENEHVEQTTNTENTNFAKEEEKEEKKEEFACSGKEEDEDKKKDYAKDDEKEREQDNKDDDKNKEEKKYSLLEEKFSALEQKYSDLEKDYQNLVAFKNDVEDKEKDALINSFYMLSDDDKKDVIDNKSKYSLEEIESKLSVICVRKKVNFNLEDSTNSNSNTETEKENPVTTFNFEASGESVPAFVAALRNTRDKKNI